jgi:hypothetical protein
VFGLVDVNDLIERFEKGEAGPKDICEAMAKGYISAKEAATLIGLTEAEVGKYCRELLREESQAQLDYMSLYQPATGGGRAGRPRP